MSSRLRTGTKFKGVPVKKRTVGVLIKKLVVLVDLGDDGAIWPQVQSAV